jgi:CO/xanthine dehydrogenase Mo-binding subunit
MRVVDRQSAEAFEDSFEFRSTTAINRSEPRVDGVGKVLGTARYTQDMHVDHANLLHAKVLRSPHAHARIRGIDTSRAAALPGVRLVLTGQDSLPRTGQPAVPRMRVMGEAFSLPAEGKVAWAGQAVAAVVAESVETALAALELIEVDYEVLPHVLDMEEARKPNPAAVVDETLAPFLQSVGAPPLPPNVCGHYRLRHGDAAGGFAEADVIVEDTYPAARISHAQLEEIACITRYESDGGLTMWTNGCGVHNQIKLYICRLLGLPEGKVRVIQATQGGSFGNRLLPSIEPLGALLALRTKGTVELTLSRREMFESSPSNWPIITKVKTGAKKDGTIVAQEIELVQDAGATIGSDGFQAGSGAVCVYDVPNVAMDTYGVLTNKNPTAAYRGLGCPQAEWAIENQVSRLAEALGMSPVEIRLKNMLQKGEENTYGEVVTSIGVAGCLEAVAEAIAVDVPSVQDDGPWRKGKGVAVGGKQNTPLGRSEADVLVHSDGTVEVRYGSDENGMGAATVMAQMTAEEFGMLPSLVRVTHGDTSTTPYDNYSASSRTTFNTGNAVVLACRDAIAQLKAEAARILQVEPESLELADGVFTVPGSEEKKLAIPDIFKPWSSFPSQRPWGLDAGTPVRGHGVFAPAPPVPWDENGRSPRLWNWYQYAACGVEVAVNTETGQIKVLKAAIANDMGNPINPSLCVGQMEGGLMMAMGFAINEEYLWDDHGVPTMTSLMDYRLPTFVDMPLSEDIKCFFAPDPLPDGPYGAKGISESGTIPVGPAIAAAVHQAVGVWPTEMPMTAERMLQLMKEKESQAG